MMAAKNKKAPLQSAAVHLPSGHPARKSETYSTSTLHVYVTNGSGNCQPDFIEQPVDIKKSWHRKSKS
jgi:hypothetical protein